MDDKSRTRKKPSAILARPAQAPSGRGAATPAASGPPTHLAAQALPEKAAEQMQFIEDGPTLTAPNVKVYIERQLKSVYDDVLNQPIPDRFLELLNALDETATGDKPKSEDKE